MKITRKKYYWIQKASPDTSIQFWTVYLNGIIADEEGKIYLFDSFKSENAEAGIECWVGDVIAAKQEDWEEYLIVEIDIKGIKGKLVQDEIGRWEQKFQSVLTQPKIFPSYFKILGTRKADFKSVDDYEASRIDSNTYPKTRKTGIELKSDGKIIYETFYDKNI